MGNIVKLIKKNGKLELVINSLVCEVPFTQTTYNEQTKSELLDYLASDDGKKRLSGNYSDDTNLEMIFDSTKVTDLFDPAKIETIAYTDESQS